MLTINKKAVNPTLILGLDISTKAGIALLDCTGGGHQLDMQTLAYPVAKGGEKFNQYPRWQKYEEAFEAIIQDRRPSFAVVEGYGFASQSLSIIVEVSTHLKRVLHRNSVPWIEVKPTALKKFVTGKGVADKNVMLLEAYKRFGIDTKDDNQCDAACLAMLGAVHAGLLPLNLPATHLEPLTKLGPAPVCN